MTPAKTGYQLHVSIGFSLNKTMGTIIPLTTTPANSTKNSPLLIAESQNVTARLSGAPLKLTSKTLSFSLTTGEDYWCTLFFGRGQLRDEVSVDLIPLIVNVFFRLTMV